MYQPCHITRIKMRVAARNRPPASEETRRKQRESSIQNNRKPPSPKGHIVTEETRQKLSRHFMGHSVSEETREKLRIANLGKISPIKGKTIVEIMGEERAAEKSRKISAARLGKTYEEIYGLEIALQKKEKISAKLKGRVFTEEHKQRIRDALAIANKDPENKKRKSEGCKKREQRKREKRANN